MPNQEQMQDRLDTYLAACDKGDIETALECFAEDATFEDPVGTPPHMGRAGVREFYEQSFQLIDGILFDVEDVIFCGNDVVMISNFNARLRDGGGTVKNHGVHNIVFNDDSLFQDVRVWWMHERLVVED